MARIEILEEQERPGGWTFRARVSASPDSPRTVRLSLSWADYNLWSPDGGDAPERVAQAVLAFALDRQGPDGVKPVFDASLVRRLFADADEAIPDLIRRTH